MDIVTLALARKYANKKVAELAAVGFAPAIVDSLPTSNINSHTLYLVPADDAINSNGYLEYLYIDGKWECVGSTVIDFSMIGDLTQLTTEDKTTLVAAINEVFASSNTAINETKNYVNEQINTTNNYVNEQITQVNNNMEARVFQGNITTYNVTGTDSYQYTYSYPGRELYVMVPDEKTINTAKEKLNNALSLE